MGFHDHAKAISELSQSQSGGKITKNYALAQALQEQSLPHCKQGVGVREWPYLSAELLSR